MMKIISHLTLLLFALSLALPGCASPDGERPRVSPPPGSHSPFGQSERNDPNDNMRDQPEPPPLEPEEEEPEEPAERE